MQIFGACKSGLMFGFPPTRTCLEINVLVGPALNTASVFICPKWGRQGISPCYHQSSHISDLEIGSPEATLSDSWDCRGSARVVWVSVIIVWLDEIQGSDKTWKKKTKSWRILNKNLKAWKNFCFYFTIFQKIMKKSWNLKTQDYQKLSYTAERDPRDTLQKTKW